MIEGIAALERTVLRGAVALAIFHRELVAHRVVAGSHLSAAAEGAILSALRVNRNVILGIGTRDDVHGTAETAAAHASRSGSLEHFDANDVVD